MRRTRCKISYRPTLATPIISGKKQSYRLSGREALQTQGPEPGLTNIRNYLLVKLENCEVINGSKRPMLESDEVREFRSWMALILESVQYRDFWSSNSSRKSRQFSKIQSLNESKTEDSKMVNSQCRNLQLENSKIQNIKNSKNEIKKP